jgi:prevent-host-death family protein
VAQQYSISEARAHLPTIIDQAEAGVEVELTRRGKPVAVVVPVKEYQRLRAGRPSFAEAYQKFLENHPLEEFGLDDDFASSVRDKGPGRKVNL